MHTRMMKFISGLALIVLFLGACTSRPTPAPAPTLPPTTVPQSTQTPTPRGISTPTATPTLPAARFIASACQFQLPPGLSEGQNIECGYLSVPANRQDPNAGTLQLATAIIHPPDGPTHEDPIIYLEGGPGESALEFLYLKYAGNQAPLLEAGRDLIIFDQRGVGLSRPALDCIEQDRLSLELLDNEINGRKLTRSEANQLIVKSMQTCAQNWAARSDLSVFTTEENAADVADLAQALRYEQVNLWGISYGTRLALEVMRSHSDIVRSAILDSSLPPDVDPYADQPENMARALNLLFDSCSADEDCNAAYPDLRKVFFDIASKLDRENVVLTAVNPLTGEVYKYALTEANWIGMVFKLLYDRDTIPQLPRLISNAGKENYELISTLAGSLNATEPALSDMMYFTLQCAEEIGQTSPEAVQAAAEKVPELREYFDNDFIRLNFDICKAIGTAPSSTDSVSKPVESDIPSLVMAGEFDPVTPPEWGELISAKLKAGYLYEFPGIGHGASIQPGCPRKLMLAFLDDPSQKPDASCLDEMPQVKFAVPILSAVEMEDFTIETLSVQGKRPAGWKEVNTGVFSRKSSSLDSVLVMVQASAVSPEATLDQLTRQFGLAQVPTPTNERRSNGLDWNLYSAKVRGMLVDFAIAESGERTIVVLLQSPTDEHEGLYTFVFLPFLDAIKALP